MTAYLGGLMFVQALALVAVALAVVPFVPIPRPALLLAAGVLLGAAVYNIFLGAFVLDVGSLSPELAVPMLVLLCIRVMFAWSLFAYMVWYVHWRGP